MPMTTLQINKLAGKTPSTPKRPLFDIQYLISDFSLAVEAASKLTLIKHNLLLEHADLFKHKKKADPDEIVNDFSSEEDDIMEDC